MTPKKGDVFLRQEGDNASCLGTLLQVRNVEESVFSMRYGYTTLIHFEQGEALFLPDLEKRLDDGRLSRLYGGRDYRMTLQE